MKRSERVHDLQTLSSKRSKSEDGAISASKHDDAIASLTLSLQMEWRLSAPEAEQTMDITPSLVTDKEAPHSPRLILDQVEFASDPVAISTTSPKSRLGLRYFVSPSTKSSPHMCSSPSATTKAASQCPASGSPRATTTQGRTLLSRCNFLTDSFLMNA